MPISIGKNFVLIFFQTNNHYLKTGDGSGGVGEIKIIH